MTGPTDTLELRQVLDLSPAEQMDILTLRNHPEVRRNMYTERVIGEDEHRAWIERLRSDQLTEVFAVMQAGRLVGIASLNAVSPEHRRADWGFYIDPAAQGAGIGTALGIAFLDHALGSLEKLNAEVLDFNERSVAYHTKLGFKHEGVRRRHIRRDGQFHDIVMMGITREEWHDAREHLIKGSTHD